MTFSILFATSFSLFSIFEINCSIFVVNSALISSVSAVSFVSILAFTSFMTAANFVIISASEFFIFSSIVSELATDSSTVPSTDSARSSISSMPSMSSMSSSASSLLLFFPFASPTLLASLMYKSTAIMPIKIAAMTIKRKLSAMLKSPTPTI